MSTAMNTARRWLVASLVDGRPLPYLSPEAWAHLPSLAVDHGLTARVDGLLHETDAPAPARQAIRDHTMRALAVQLQVEADLHLLVPVMQAAGVPWMVVKGPVLAQHWYERRDQRSYVDLDVVVDPAGFRKVLEALTRSGARLLDQNFTHALRQRRAELSLLLRHGTPLDLHWHVLNTPEVRAELPLPVGEMLDRRIHASVGGVLLPTLDPTDTVLHLCLHTVLSGGHRLLWYRDLQQVIARGEVDWDALANRAEHAGAGAVVAVALRRARRLAGAAVPLGFERRVSPNGRAWRWTVETLDAARPLGGPLGTQLSGRIAVQATRGTTRSSCRALRRIARSELVEPLLHDPRHPWRSGRAAPSSSGTNPLWQPTEDPLDRERYLDYVSGQAEHGRRGTVTR